MKIVILITGLSGSGKTTIARGIQKRFGIERVRLIDGDSIRKKSRIELGFSRIDRFRHLQEMAILACSADEEVSIVASIAPYEDARTNFCETVNKTKKVIVIYNRTPLETCELRDPKGLYKDAREGKVAAFTGISDPYEIPENADFEIDTSYDSVEVSVEKIDIALEKLTRKK